ncbi:hypothetical protein [Crocinitomix catalasitica]|uniref:hypothetical protein n=1 Tax=Crocinitomix catalasitica TaxID=184607 RepID=UPI0012F7705C|nr:hypothetical protein [Crocinitomix catalasitica]
MKYFLILIFFTVNFSFSQVNLNDGPINTLLFGLNYKANYTGGDLSKKWGFTNHLGADVNYKFENNVTIGLDGGFLFGKQLRSDDAFKYVINSFGQITSLTGDPASVLILMRGATAHFDFGYVFNRFGNNPNSGIWVKAGGGFLMHKSRIESLYDDVPQLEGEYRKGYDELTMGVSTKQFVGYLFQANRRLIKMYAGFEFVQGFTKNVRSYNFALGGPDNSSKFDMMYGFKVGYIIPIYKRTRTQYYTD